MNAESNRMKNFHKIKQLLDERVELYNTPAFITNDPIAVPHRFSKKQDIEIAGFFAAIFAWGNRKTIINKATEFLQLMDNAPYQFICQFSDNDLKPFLHFKHRTFNGTDAILFLHFFRDLYQTHNSLEDAFLSRQNKEISVETGLNMFYQKVITHPYFQKRSGKHLSCPAKKSSCKRINMYLRWMVRNDNKGVDFGIWKKIKPSMLYCPLDVHVEKVARRFGLIERKQTDWKTVIELTDQLRRFDPEDPVKYDFALFGLSTEEKQF